MAEDTTDLIKLAEIKTCMHEWEPISTDRTKEEYVSGFGDSPEICRKCGSLKRGDGKPPSGVLEYNFPWNGGKHE